MKLRPPYYLADARGRVAFLPESGWSLPRERSEPTTEVSQGRIVGYDSNLPWNLSEEKKVARCLVCGKPVCLDRAVYQRN